MNWCVDFVFLVVFESIRELGDDNKSLDHSRSVENRVRILCDSLRTTHCLYTRCLSYTKIAAPVCVYLCVSIIDLCFVIKGCWTTWTHWILNSRGSWCCPKKTLTGSVCTSFICIHQHQHLQELFPSEIPIYLKIDTLAEPCRTDFSPHW